MPEQVSLKWRSDRRCGWGRRWRHRWREPGHRGRRRRGGGCRRRDALGWYQHSSQVASINAAPRFALLRGRVRGAASPRSSLIIQRYAALHGKNTARAHPPHPGGGLPGTEHDGEMYTDYRVELGTSGREVWEWHSYELTCENRKNLSTGLKQGDVGPWLNDTCRRWRCWCVYPMACRRWSTRYVTSGHC
jgi:hypothetical protein